MKNIQAFICCSAGHWPSNASKCLLCEYVLVHCHKNNQNLGIKNRDLHSCICSDRNRLGFYTEISDYFWDSVLRGFLFRWYLVYDVRIRATADDILYRMNIILMSTCLFGYYTMSVAVGCLTCECLKSSWQAFDLSTNLMSDMHLTSLLTWCLTCIWPLY